MVIKCDWNNFICKLEGNMGASAHESVHEEKQQHCAGRNLQMLIQ